MEEKRERLFRGEEGNLVTESELRKDFCSMMQSEAPEYDGMSFNEYIEMTDPRNNGTLEELIPDRKGAEEIKDYLERGYEFGYVDDEDGKFHVVLKKENYSPHAFSWELFGLKGTAYLSWSLVHSVINSVFVCTPSEFFLHYEARKVKGYRKDETDQL